MLWYSLVVPHRGTSNEYHYIYFCGEIRKISIMFLAETKMALFGATAEFQWLEQTLGRKR